MSLWEWPALGEKPQRPIRLTCQRAIYGKPDSAQRDFDFVAASPGFSRARKDLEMAFVVKDQQQPGKIPLWWQAGGRYYASYCYPSRVSDLTRRPGLETQILECDPGTLPVALGALLMLREIASRTDEDWIKWSRDPGFADPGYELPLEPLEIIAKEEDVDAIIQSGLAGLQKISDQSLKEFYARLNARKPGQKTGSPALLTGVKVPLAPACLAALLLAAPPEKAKNWSLAGWPTEHLHWDGMACESAPAKLPQGPLPSRADQDRAAMMAYALQQNKPMLAGGPSGEVVKILEFARGSARDVDPSRLPRKATPISAAEAKLLGEAVTEVAAAAIPEYLQNADEKVRKAFLRQMTLKAESIKAWWLVVHPPADLLTWQAAYSLSENWRAAYQDKTQTGVDNRAAHCTSKDWLAKILEMWGHENPLAQERRALLDQATGSTLSSTP